VLPLGAIPWEFCSDFWHQKTRVSAILYGSVLRDPPFSRFGTVPACVRRTKLHKKFVVVVVVVVVVWYWFIHDMTETVEVTEVEYTTSKWQVNQVRYYIHGRKKRQQLTV